MIRDLVNTQGFPFRFSDGGGGVGGDAPPKQISEEYIMTQLSSCSHTYLLLIQFCYFILNTVQMPQEKASLTDVAYSTYLCHSIWSHFSRCFEVLMGPDLWRGLMIDLCSDLLHNNVLWPM